MRALMRWAAVAMGRTGPRTVRLCALVGSSFCCLSFVVTVLHRLRTRASTTRFYARNYAAYRKVYPNSHISV